MIVAKIADTDYISIILSLHWLVKGKSEKVKRNAKR